MFLPILFSCVPVQQNDLEFNTGVATITNDNQPIFGTENLPPVEGKTGYHAASITELSNGELMTTWYSYSGNQDELTVSAIYTSIKNQNWSTPSLFRDSPQGDGNPVLYSEGERIWLFQAVVPGGWSSAHIEFQYSETQGIWSSPITMPGPIGSNVKYPPIRLMNGELLLPAYDDLMIKSIFFSSTDGINWTQRATLSTPGFNGTNIQPAIVQLSSGRIIATMRDTQGQGLWVSYSDDNGFIWATPKYSGFPNPGTASCLIKLKNGNLVLIFNNANDRINMSACLSQDEGKTFTVPKTIFAEDCSYPSAVQTNDGMIHVVFSKSRDSIAHAWFNESWIVN
jgi:predicted neuraminidase